MQSIKSNQRLLRRTKQKAIDKAAEAKRVEIDQTPNATEEEKQWQNQKSMKQQTM